MPALARWDDHNSSLADRNDVHAPLARNCFRLEQASWKSAARTIKENAVTFVPSHGFGQGLERHPGRAAPLEPQSRSSRPKGDVHHCMTSATASIRCGSKPGSRVGSLRLSTHRNAGSAPPQCQSQHPEHGAIELGAALIRAVDPLLVDQTGFVSSSRRASRESDLEVKPIRSGAPMSRPPQVHAGEI